MRAPTITNIMRGDGLAKSGLTQEISVKDPPYDAVGDGVIDDTAAIQAAFDAAGYVSLPFGAGGEPSIIGGEGLPIYFPPGHYRVTDTIYYYPGQTIRGCGLQSWIDFQPITALKDLFAPQAGVGHPGTDIFRTLYFEKFLLTSNSIYGSAAIHFEKVMHWVATDVTIIGFKYGILNDGDAGLFYNRLIGLEVFDCEIGFDNKGNVCYVEESIFQPKLLGGGLWEATAIYGIRSEAVSLSVVNCSFEGDEITAGIYSKDVSGLVVSGCYYENSPLVLLGMDRPGRSWGQTSITGNHGFPVLIKFKDLMETPTDGAKYPHGITLGGNYRLLKLLANPSAKRGSLGWTVSNGVIAQSPDTFLSRFAFRVTADGTGICHFYTDGFERPLGARLTVTFLCKLSHPEIDSLVWSNLTTDILFRPYKVIEYGNGWKLWAFDVENTDGSFALTSLDLSLTQGAAQAPDNGHYMDISNVRIYEGEGFDILPDDTQIDIELISAAVPTDGTWEVREKVWKPAPAGSSSPGWICTSSGTFSAATDNTGDTDGTTATIIGMTDTGDFYVGQYVITSAGFPNSADDGNTPVKIISKTSTTLVIDDTSDTSESNITVSTPDPVFKAMADLAV